MSANWLKKKENVQRQLRNSLLEIFLYTAGYAGPALGEVATLYYSMGEAILKRYPKIPTPRLQGEIVHNAGEFYTISPYNSNIGQIPAIQNMSTISDVKMSPNTFDF